ncbi:uncharacterized protein LOC119632325 isoform X1 [Glossina fuscipes]|uniref:Uncharacterized protein LOC119632325 isoform X1 n=1 Tax=Glossina fuscipes TaxID=7396 RepID=A0A8U0W7K6_9MUSC|nr:uncharacterized protein LOC119632325 isoform X1 [Glossina fuscipes]
MFRNFLWYSFFEEENKDIRNAKERITKRQARKDIRDATDHLALPQNHFMHKFRVSKVAFSYVLDKIGMTDGIIYTGGVELNRDLLTSGGYQCLVCSDQTVNTVQSSLPTVVPEVFQELETKLCVE